MKNQDNFPINREELEEETRQSAIEETLRKFFPDLNEFINTARSAPKPDTIVISPAVLHMILWHFAGKPRPMQGNAHQRRIRRRKRQWWRNHYEAKGFTIPTGPYTR